MMLGLVDWLVFGMALLVTLGAAAYATRLRKLDARSEAVAGRSLGPWVLALSAGATANSGFVLTGAIGLGYTGGLMWCLLPLGWLLGDLVFWAVFAGKVNKASRSLNAVTLPEIVQKGAKDARATMLRKLVGGVLVALSLAYIGAQWLSAGKIAAAVLELPSLTCAVAFGVFVVLYTAFSGVRGAVYTDFVQAIFMSLLAVAVMVMAVLYWPADWAAATATMPAGFFSLRGTLEGWQVALMALGFAAMALGFNLGQPQMVTRWMSGESEKTMRQARWIYMGFLQLTWLSYTALGALIAVLMPHLADPEQGLVAFVKGYGMTGMMGLLMAGAVSTIASSAAAMLATCAEMLRHDVLPGRLRGKGALAVAVMGLGALSMSSLLVSGSSVFNLAITAVGMMGAALAAPVMWVALGKKMTQEWATCAVVCGLAAAMLWKMAGWDATLNEVVPGLVAGLMVLALGRKG